MVDFLYNSSIGEETEKVEDDKKNQTDLLSVPEFDEYSLSFADSLLDFDSLRDFLLDTNDDVGTHGISVNQELSHIGVSENGLNVELPMGDLGCCIVEEEMGRVTISGTQNERMVDRPGNSIKIAETDDGSVAALISKNEESDKVDIASREVNGIKNAEADVGSVAAVISKNEESDKAGITSREVNGSELKSDEDVRSNRDMESESESESSSDDEISSNEEAEGELDLEEGEFLPSDSDEDDDGTDVKGPIRSKNEVQVLPPVPQVTATLQPHHWMQPVGSVSSIIGAQVVVEGVEKHTPLNDGSILWITESRSPLGIVDEIFGPVKNPYYIVRYNSDHEIPPEIHPGTLISFVPEFSNHILNDNSLYKKGYDASGENDEEASEDEFSDDEKEAEYKRMLKMKKRDITNDPKPGNKKKDKRNLKNRSQNWKHDQGAATDVQHENGKPSLDQSQRFIPSAAAPLDQVIHPSASLQGHGQSIRPLSIPPFPHMQNSPGLAAPSTGIWTNRIPYQQPQNTGFPNTLPNIGMPWPQQGHPAQIFQMPLPNALPFEQQINPTLLSSFMFPGGLLNFGAGPSFAPWLALGQNIFSQSPMAMGLPGQFAFTPMNLGGQTPANEPQSGHNNNSQPHSVVPGSNFNQGAHSSGGRRGTHRGGGCFGGRRGRSQRN